MSTTQTKSTRTIKKMPVYVDSTDNIPLITGKTSADGRLFSCFMAKSVSVDTVLDRKLVKTFGPGVLADQGDFVGL
jgi:hypothetical protein